MFQGLKFPNNASEMNKSLIKIAGFDLIDTEKWIDPYIIDLGEGSPFSYNFEQCDYETEWLLGNSSFIVWTYVLNIAGFLMFLLLSLLSYKTRRCASLVSKMRGYFVFNCPLRLFMETFLDLYLSSSLNVLTADNQTENSYVLASNYLSYGVFGIFSILVLALPVLYWLKFSEIGPESTYDALLDGTRNDGNSQETTTRSKWILFFLALFFARRIALIISVLCIGDYLWVQLAIQFAFSTTMMIYLMHVWPLMTSFANKMEVFNECTIIVLHYGLMCFTDFVPEPDTRYQLGWHYIIVFLSNLLVHLSVLFSTSGKQI